jgi:DNA-binding NarL/FixJ family response regulator
MSEEPHGNPAGDTVKVVVLEDHQMVAAAFRGALDADRRIDVVGVASDLERGVELIAARRPDVAVVDVRLGEVETTEHLDRLVGAHPGVRLLMVTGWPTERALFAALEAGATGFLTKKQSIEEFIDAVLRVASGETVVAPVMLPAVVQRSNRRAGARSATLTPRETEVLYLLSTGLSTAEVAARLHLSVNTVRNHVGSLMTKLGAHNRLEAVNEGVRRGIISPASPG